MMLFWESEEAQRKITWVRYKDIYVVLGAMEFAGERC